MNKTEKKFDWKLVGIIAVIVIALIVTGVVIPQSFQDTAFKMEERLETALSTISTAEKRRLDLWSGMANAIMSYNKYEAETLQAIIGQRVSDSQAEQIDTMIMANVERYPKLESHDNYKAYMKEQAITENQIKAERDNYNIQVGKYNTYNRTFINRTMLGIVGYEPQTYDRITFDVSSDAPVNLLN